MKIAVLMTCHNRKETTLSCLRGLMPQLGAEDRVFLVDDGSTDGTGEEVKRMFECSNVLNGRVIKGNGNLFWAKGMRLAWETAVKEGDWDAYLWLNDDTQLEVSAIARLRKVGGEGNVAVGGLIDSSGAKVYGLCEDGIFSGNVVFVPRRVYEEVGMICGCYHHAWADVDYALHCKQAGIGVVEVEAVGKAKGHPFRPDPTGCSFRERVSMLLDPKGWCIHDVWVYRRRNFGLIAAMVSCIHLVFHVLMG